MVFHDEEIRRRFRDASRSGKITCSECLRLGDELGIDRREIAPTLSEMGIKIIGCQLGCFP
ncbi:MAG: hypothetical protein ACMUIG_02265 [Thermoplasmatota archaeon]